jgi:hypothetical protein
MTTSIRPTVTAHRGKFNIRVRDGRDWTRLTEGEGLGNFSLGPYGVMIHGSADVWTLIPWSNITIIEPTT